VFGLNIEKPQNIKTENPTTDFEGKPFVDQNILEDMFNDGE
jgi:hypothetical protein